MICVQLGTGPVRKDGDPSARQSIIVSEDINCIDSTPQVVKPHFGYHLPLANRRGAHAKRIDTSIIVDIRAYRCRQDLDRASPALQLHGVLGDHSTSVDHAGDSREGEFGRFLRTQARQAAADIRDVDRYQKQ